jgi:ketosteroid isomerase-like protein
MSGLHLMEVHMGEREEFLGWARSRLRDAEEALHNGDAAPRLAIWSRNDPVTVLGAWKSANGQEELTELFRQLAASFSDCVSYSHDIVAADVVGDMAYTVGYEQTQTSVNGEPRRYTLRATQVYRREDGEWKVAHRHADTVPEAESRRSAPPPPSRAVGNGPARAVINDCHSDWVDEGWPRRWRRGQSRTPITAGPGAKAPGSSRERCRRWC